MSYEGTVMPVLVGQAGLESDLSQPLETPFSPFAPNVVRLLLASNVSCRYGSVEKEPGSVRWNQAPLPSGISSFFDWWPSDTAQRVIVSCNDGNVYRFTDQFNRAIVQPLGGAPAVLNFSPQSHMASGGAESQGNARKLFLFSGNDPVQVIKGDAQTRADIQLPAFDWGAQNWPTYGLVHNGALWCFGNRNNRHMLYRSNPDDHEDFQTQNAVQLVPVFPGEFDGIQTAFVWKTRLYVVKYPYGLYFVDDSTETIGVFKLSESFGAASAHSAIGLIDDMLCANSSGSITSLQAVQALGNTEQGDLLKSLRALQYMRDTTAQSGVVSRQAVYYEDKKQAIFTYRSPSGFQNDRILKIDYHSDAPKVTWSDKDQANCLGLVRDFRSIPIPLYGSNDGYLYFMDSPMRNVGGNAYAGTFQTMYLDFGFLDKRMAEKDKLFDFVGLTFEPTGNWPIFCDVFVDEQFVETIQFNLSRGAYLDGKFPLDKTRLKGPGPKTLVEPIHGIGKRISLKLYNDTLNQTFKVSGIQFYFRMAGENNE